MSYIVPMKKPICINCPFRSLDSCTLIYLMSDKDSEVTVHVNEMTVSPDCPLVEIPTPHGRLIDAINCDITITGRRNAELVAETIGTFVDRIKALPPAVPKTGKWIDHRDEGYVECPFCRSATNCDGNIDELHYCFSCGARMEVTE